MINSFMKEILGDIELSPPLVKYNCEVDVFAGPDYLELDGVSAFVRHLFGEATMVPRPPDSDKEPILSVDVRPISGSLKDVEESVTEAIRDMRLALIWCKGEILKEHPDWVFPDLGE